VKTGPSGVSLCANINGLKYEEHAWPQLGPLEGPEFSRSVRRAFTDIFSERRDGKRTRLFQSGVRFDFQYISNSLWNIKSEQKERLASWNRFRGTVDIDFGALVEQPGWYFHATALWQGGAISEPILVC
jgi:hypothetical protein